MNDFIEDMGALFVQNRTFALAENGSWAPVAGKLMREKVSAFKNVTVLEDTFSFRSALHAGDMAKLDAFVDAVAKA